MVLACNHGESEQSLTTSDRKMCFNVVTKPNMERSYLFNSSVKWIFLHLKYLPFIAYITYQRVYDQNSAANCDKV